MDAKCPFAGDCFVTQGEAHWSARRVAPIATVLLLLSVWSGGVRAHTGDWIDSAYTTALPTIDGTLSPGEWASATVVDLVAIPGNGLPGFLLIENNATFLYVAYDALGD